MKHSIKIQNLKCSGCANTITKKLNKMKDITEVSVDNETSIVSFVAADDSRLDEVKRELSSLGYPALNEENKLGKKAKSYLSCVVGKISD